MSIALTLFLLALNPAPHDQAYVIIQKIDSTRSVAIHTDDSPYARAFAALLGRQLGSRVVPAASDAAIQIHLTGRISRHRQLLTVNIDGTSTGISQPLRQAVVPDARILLELCIRPCPRLIRCYFTIRAGDTIDLNTAASRITDSEGRYLPALEPATVQTYDHPDLIVYFHGLARPGPVTVTLLINDHIVRFPFVPLDRRLDP